MSLELTAGLGWAGMDWTGLDWTGLVHGINMGINAGAETNEVGMQ